MFKNVFCDPRQNILYPCPCCKHRTLEERGGFEICSVCFWEDDGQDEHDADLVRGGPNGSLNLRTAQENYKKIGAVEARFKPHVRPPTSLEKTNDQN